MTEQELRQKAEEYSKKWKKFASNHYLVSVSTYTAGWKACESSDEYVKMKEKSEKWDKVQEVLDGAELAIHYPDGKHVIVVEQQK